MTVRWMIAGAAAVGAGVMAVPMLLGRTARVDVDEPAMMASHPTAATCKADGKGKLESFTVKDMNGADVRLADITGRFCSTTGRPGAARARSRFQPSSSCTTNTRTRAS
jgi:hypothetical protein